MTDLEYRVPSPHYLRLTLEDRALCLTSPDDPILSSTKLCVKPSPSDEVIIAELNNARIAMNPQSNSVMTGQSVDEETSTSEDEEDTKGRNPVESIPILGGAHGPVVTKWLKSHFVVQPNNSLSRGDIFQAYIVHCERNNITHCNPATFGKILRSIFPDVKTRRIGTRGNSRYHYCGIGVNPKTERQQNGIQKDREKQLKEDNTSLANGQFSNILVEYSQELLPLLHSFPTCEDIGLLKSENQVVQDFLDLTYRWHAVRLLDCVLRAEFYQIRDIIVEFWRSIPALTLKLLSDPLVVAAIERCDQIIYRNMNGLLLPHVLVPLPSGLMLTLKNFVKNLLHWHQDGLNCIPPIIKYAKVKACYRFKTSFLRQIQLNHMSIMANSVVESQDTAATIQRAWHQLQRTFKNTPLFYHFSPASIGADLVYQFLQEYGNLWDTSCSLSEHLNWVEGVVLKSMEKVTRLSQNKLKLREELIRQFVLEWTYISTQIFKMTTFICLETLGPLHLLDMFYRDYMLFLLERWDVQ
uniref:RFX-type winged-helix domain-containing protein n=1 Tax=Magallana gigas TaxID=29159 RepID=A0A8W8IJZ8_MAGGI|nr:transcription factor RFX4-like [Crassostrea gigas]